VAGHIFPQGRQDFIKNQLGLQSPENLLLHLYGNRHIPVDGDTVSSYTELNFQGYSAQVLLPMSWTIAPSNPNFPLQSLATYPTVSWTCTGGGTISTVAWGYFVTGQSSGHLLFAELLAASIQFGEGSTVNVNVSLNFGSQF
jgi:hypothetical protein